MAEMCIVSILILSAITFSPSQQEVITVDSTNGNDTLCTHNNSYPCKTLHATLKAVRDDTIVQICNGTYPHNTTTTLTYSNVSITGSGSDVTIVECDSNGTGFGFINVTNIHFSRLTMQGCGALRISTTLNISLNSAMLFRAALYFLTVINVTIDDVVVSNSTGMGVAMYDVTGRVTVTNSVFRNNSVPSHESTLYPGGGGFSVEFSYCKAGSELSLSCSNINNGSSYLFYNCTFDFNVASTLNQTETSYSSRTFGISNQQLGRGGGLSVFFKGHSQQNIINISDCTFDSNHAVWGGGFHSDILDYSTGNKLIIQNCNFTNNHCHYSDSLMTTGTGGGGARIAFLFYDQESEVTDNSVEFIDCVFQHNIAYFGGGLSCRITKEDNVIIASNSLELVDCTWIENSARTGSGVDIISHVVPHGLSPVVRIVNCNFTGNNNSYSNQSAFPSGIGALYADNIPVEFSGNCVFHQNHDSAIAGVATYFMFANDSCAEFSNNFGWHGAAIALLGNAYFMVYHNTSLTFVKNAAVTKGGAIYYVNSGQKNFFSTQRCLFYYYDLSVSNYSKWRTSFSFSGNKALYGNSIYCTTLLTCIWSNQPGSATVSEEDILQVFNWSGIFHYDSSSNRSDEIATDTAEITTYGSNSVVRIPPGQFYQLNITSVDDRQGTAHPVFFAQTNNTSISSVDNTTRHISDKYIKLHGMIHSNISLHLQSINSRSWSVTINVIIDDCPPGFYYPYKENSEKVCKCATGEPEEFYGIGNCDNEKLVAYLHPYCWVGIFVANGSKTVFTSDCPRDYCNGTKIQLPPVSLSYERLDYLICSNNRNDTLCGNCRHGYYVYANSPTYTCGHCNDTWSKHGFLILVVSKYVPLTVMMCFIMFFDISLVDGPLNSFILYSQILITIPVYEKAALPTKASDFASVLIEVAYFLYNIWDLKFFEHVIHKFCAFKFDSAMPIIIVEYIPAFYVLFLCVLFFIVVPWMYNWCTHSRLAAIRNCILKIERMCIRFRNDWSVKNSVIHSLTTFLVLSYARVTLVTFKLLTSTILLGPGGLGSTNQRKVARFDGTMSYFGQDHLPYAIVALLILATFVLIPPLFLLSYPLLPALMTRLGLEDYWIVKKLIVTPLSKCVPIFDAFQSCYKDQYRFFAGLLFVYRILALAIFAFTPTTALNLAWMQGFLLSVLLLHCICQPYKERWHNFIEGSIFTVLASVTIISFYRFFQAETSQDSTDISYWIQTVLLYCPFIYFLVYMSYKVFLLLRPRIVEMIGKLRNNYNNSLNVNCLVNSREFPARLETDEDDISSTTTSESVASDSEEQPQQQEQLQGDNDDVEMLLPVQWNDVDDSNNTSSYIGGNVWATQ